MTLALRFLGALVAVGAVLAAPYAAHSYPQGAPSGSAGNFGFTCASSGCHDSFELNSGTGSVAIDAPDVVAPGETVTITVTVDNTTPPAPGAQPVQGFEAAVRDLSTGATGGVATGTLTLTDPDATRYPVGDSQGEYVTHTVIGQEQTSWSFDWTAPAEGGSATIYAAGNAANGNAGGGSGGSGDYVYTTTREVAISTDGEAGPAEAAIELSAPRPNPARSSASAVLSLPAAAAVVARLVDGRGRTVREIARAERRAGEQPVAFRVDGLAPGTYFLVVEADGARRTQPVVVAR